MLNFLPLAFGGGGESLLLFYFYSVALMNHSCCPNVIVTYKGTLAEVRAVKEIEPGEEVNALCLNVLYACILKVGSILLFRIHFN